MAALSSGSDLGKAKGGWRMRYLGILVCYLGQELGSHMGGP